MFPVSLNGRRIALRELSREDSDDLHKVYGDATTVEHLSFTPRSVGQCGALIESAIADAEAQPRRVYMLAVTLDSELVGAARLSMDERPHSAQVGFALRHELWDQGFGAELVGLLLRFGFDELGLARVWGARSPENEASRSIMVRAGMIEEGRIRRHLRKNDAWRDSVVHSILSDEWIP